MKKKLMLLTFLLINSILIGCNPNDNSEEQVKEDNSSEGDYTDEKLGKDDNKSEVSPLFEAGPYTMIGEKGRIGFIYNEREGFIPNNKQKYMWHLWGEPESLKGEFKVIGTNKTTGEKVTVVEVEDIGEPNQVNSSTGADVRMPSLMSLPSSGIWELEAYVGGELFGTVVIECQE